MKKTFLLTLGMAALLMLSGCDDKSIFEDSYPYAFFCQENAYGKAECKMTASPDIRYSQSEKQSILAQMEILEASFAQAGRLVDGFASVHMHYAMGAPMTVRVSEKTDVPLLGGWKSVYIYSYIGDTFSKVVDKENDTEFTKSYIVSESIKDVDFKYALSIPKVEQLRGIVFFTLLNANSIVVYAKSADGGERFQNFMNSLQK